MVSPLFLFVVFILFFIFPIFNFCNAMYRSITILWDKLTGTSLKKSKLLYEAIKKNDFALFKTLIDSHATFNYKTENGNFIIHELVRPDNIEYLNYAHKKGLLFSSKKNTPYFCSNDRGYADLEIKNSHDETLLHHACRFDNINAVKLLIDYDVPLYEADKNGDIPLFLINQKTEILEQFKKNSSSNEWKKICTEYRNKNGYNLIHAIVSNDNNYTEAYILKKDRENLVQAMIKANSANLAKYILDDFPDLLNQKDTKQRTPLHIAVLYRCHNIFDLLLTYKDLDVTIQDIEGNSAAMYALYWNDSSGAFQRIIEYDKKALNTPNSDGETPLLYIIKYAEDINEIAPYAQFLITKGADVHVKDKDGNTPLHYAIKQGNKELADILTAS